MRPICNITPDRFARYGRVLAHTEGYSGAFEILVREALAGWRLAVFSPGNRDMDTLENHPASCESFQPIRGTSLIVVAANDAPDDYEVFLLDRPVCLHKGTWHANIALTDDVLIQVAENLEVECVFHVLGQKYAPGLGAVD